MSDNDLDQVLLAPVRPISLMTLSPAVDVSYEVETLHIDEKTHARSNRFDPGGNGINVARALGELGIVSSNVIIAAGTMGELLRHLVGEPSGTHWVKVDGETRVNATIIQAEPPAQFEITGVGPTVTEVALAEVAEIFLGGALGGYGVLTGSLPPGTPEDFYCEMVSTLTSQGALAVVDSRGSILEQTLRYKPFLIKPNQYELGQLCGQSVSRIEQVITQARRLHEGGVANVCVSLGARGAVLVCEEGCFVATAPDIKVISTVGSGDSMVGGLLASLASGASASFALKLGVACGSATATKPGTALFAKADLGVLLDEISVTRA